MNVQDAIFRLSHYWAEAGCLVLPPCEYEIQGGILHPDTFFRLLDSEPWRAAYLQTVRRPLDGRYGRHPFRLGRHLQFQVILKAPGQGVREQYLGSLRELGLELEAHDLRFTEWKWQAYSLDAWGLGWQVHLDGLGITRLTFLQQVAGRELNPVAIEISYGLERLLMTVTRTRDAFRLPWTENGPEYGELWRRDEIELTRYAREVADVEGLESNLKTLGEEARRALDAGLVRMAYELTVRSLQSIDLLDSRGVLSARDRMTRLGRVRELVREIANAEMAGNQAAENQAAENQAAENQAAENQAAENQAAENQAAENQAAENQVAATRPPGDPSTPGPEEST